MLSIRDNWVVFFDLFSKNGNGDSIRPLAEELRKRRPDMKFFFCCSKRNKLKYIDFADEILTERTLKFDYVVFRAKYLFSPMDFPKLKKRKGQVWVQTWHGSPLKKLYLSKDRKNKTYLHLSKRMKQADMFCNQADIHVQNLIEAFEISPEQIYNTGLPRNDILFVDASDDFKNNLKKELGLPIDKKIILYCPTWRRRDYKAVVPFDYKKIKESFKDEYALLLRSHVGKHHWIDENGSSIDIIDNEFIFDAGKYPECTHLYTISDVLISDYSSSIFDFAITGKPQIFYAYDLEDYSNEFGLYFDYKRIIPGDMPVDTESLIESIKTIPQYFERYGEKYNNFRELYCGAEKGTATKQILDFVLKM